MPGHAATLAAYNSAAEAIYFKYSRLECPAFFWADIPPPSTPWTSTSVNMSKRLSGLVPGRRRNDSSADQQAEEDVDWSLPIGASAAPAIAPAAAPKYGIGGSSHYLGLSPRWG